MTPTNGRNSALHSNKFQDLQELMEEDVRWQRVKGAVISTYNVVLGPRSPNDKKNNVLD